MKEYLEIGNMDAYDKIYLSEYEDSRRVPVFVKENISKYVNKQNKFKKYNLSNNKIIVKEDCIFYVYLSYRGK